MKGLSDLTGESEPVVLKVTPRQRAVLALLCEGLQNKQIARHLNIAPATVKIHVHNILKTMNVCSRVQAAIAAVSVGFEQQAQGRSASTKIEQVSSHSQMQLMAPVANFKIDKPVTRNDHPKDG